MSRIFPAFVGFVLLILGLGIVCSPTVLGYDTLTVNTLGEEYKYDFGFAPLAFRKGSAVRAEVNGDADAVLSKLGAKELWRESIDENLEVIYGYSNRFSEYETVHGKKVNVMIAVRGNKLSVGIPLLMGSY